MADFDQFKNEWLGRNVADPLLAGDHPYQCVSFVKQYLRECFGIEAGWWGDAIDYWTKTNPAILSKFSRLATHDVVKGDIVILNGLPGNAYGHIGIATGNQNPTQFELLEQNGATGGGLGQGGDAIRTRYVNKDRIAGLLRPGQVAPPTPPAPTYTVVENYPNGKQVKLNKQPTNLWGMNYADVAYMSAHPVETHNQGEIWTVTNKVHHVNGYDYYRREGQVDGFNVLDCDDYAPAPPAPQGAYMVPSGKTVTLYYDLRGYNSATQAGNLEATFKQMVPKGTYNVYRYYSDDRTDLVNVKSADGSIWAWINTNEENVIKTEIEKKAADEAARLAAEEQAKKDAAAAQEIARKKAEADRILANRGSHTSVAPAPAPEVIPVTVQAPKVYKPSEVPLGDINGDNSWRARIPVNPDRSVSNFQLVRSVKAIDYTDSRKNPITFYEGDEFTFRYYFVKNGVKFYTFRATNDEFDNWRFGIPLFNDDGNPNFVKLVEPLQSRERMLSDFLHYWRSDLKEVWDVLVKKIGK